MFGSNKLVSLTIYVTFLVIKLMGLIPLHYNINTERFESSWWSLSYSILIFSTFCIIFPQMYVHSMLHVEDSLSWVKNISAPYSTINISTAGIIFAYQIIFRKRVIKSLNEAKICYYTVTNYLKDDIDSYPSILYYFFVKGILFPIFIVLSLMLGIWHLNVSGKILYIICLMIPYLIRSAIPNCFYGGLLICNAYTEILNKKVQKIIKKINIISNHEEYLEEKYFLKMRNFCELSDQLDEVAKNYAAICKLAQLCLDLSAVPLLLILFCSLYVTIIELFAAYVRVENTLLYGEAFPLLICLSGLAYTAVVFLDMYLEANIATDNINEIRLTGMILHGSHLDNVDIRFRRSIETFSLNILQEDYRITICGLFDLNRSLMHDAVANATSIILLLMQFELADRFSKSTN